MSVIYLYLKTHNRTGLKYLGMTEKNLMNTKDLVYFGKDT